jgi:Mg/Co/Ni transporter MgtE
MPTVTFRISDEDKRRLAKRGKISDEMREAVRRYLDSEDSEEVFLRLQDLQQRNRVRTTPEEIVRMIKEDRYHDRGRQ